MKELTIEEKAQRYDENVNKLRRFMEQGVDPLITRADVQDFFPELKGSDDEKIRKALVKIISDIDGGFPFEKHGIFKKEACAWLEKQGDKDKFIKKEIGYIRDYREIAIKRLKELERLGELKPIFRVGDTIQKVSTGDIVTISEIDTKNKEYRLANTGFIPFEYEHLWQLVEQKPTNKVEPKFKVGDWITDNGHSYLIGYIDYDQRRYLFEVGGYTHEPLNWEYIETADNKYHLWSVQDAKDGDVLVASDGSIFLFKGVLDDIMVKHYVALTTDNTVKFNKGLRHYWEVASAVQPATKKQRDLLFQKVKEAGYEWDAEKKKLKPYMIQWKGDNLEEVINFTGKSKNFDKWFKSFEEYKMYVKDHDSIFKIFYEDGSHYEVPVGAWIIKTPDGYNVASQATFVQKKGT